MPEIEPRPRRHSYSAMSTLANCERAYANRYLRGLESAKPEDPKFARGNAFHALVEADLIGRGLQHGTLLTVPQEIRVVSGLALPVDPANPPTPGEILDRLDAWESDLDFEQGETLAAACDGQRLADRVADMWVRYSRYWERENAVQAPLLVEFTWRRTAPNGKELTGRVDAALWDTERELVIVRDSKTHQEWPSEPDAVLDLMDSQLHLQAWGIAPTLRELAKRAPQAVEFDRVKAKRPKPPTLTLAGKLSGSGPQPGTGYDGHTYREWCETGPTPEISAAEAKKGVTEKPPYLFDPDVYAAAEADREAWFRRSLKPLSMRAVTQHVLAAARQAERAEALDAELATMSPGKACAWCPFLNLCRAEIIGGLPEPFVPADFGLRYRRSR